MALNPNIALAGNVPQVSLANALMQGISAGEAIRNAPLIAAMNQQKLAQARQSTALNTQTLQSNEMSMQDARRQRQVQDAGFVRNAALRAQMASEDPAEQMAAFKSFIPELQNFGIDMSDMPEDATLESIIRQTSSVVSAAQQNAAMTGGGAKPVGTPIRVKLPDGSIGFAQGVWDPVTQSLRADTTALPAGTEVVSSQFGETGQEAAAREVETFQERREVEAETASDISAESGRGAGVASRESADIARGLELAQGLPNLKRAIALLDAVKTGGLARAKLAATDLFGVTGADEGELSGNLGKAVLGQLRETFGAQFTKEEGDRLQGIEARFGVNPAVNRRLLANVIQVAEQAAERGMRAAGDAGDYRAAAEIQELMGMTLDPDAVLSELAPEGAEARPQVLDWNDL